MPGRIPFAACIVCFVLASGVAAGETAREESIAWRKDLAAATAEATKGGGLMVVYLTRGNCPWCTKMEKETLADGRVIAALGKFVPVKVRELEPRQAMMRKHGLTGVPATLVLAPDGGLVSKIVGYRPPPEFLGELEKARESHVKYAQLTAAAEANPDDLEAVLKVAEMDLERGRIPEAVTGFASARLLDTAKKFGARIDVGEAMALIESGEGGAEEGRKRLETVAEKYPRSEEAPKALFMLGTALAEDGDMAGGEKVLAQVIARYPRSVEAPGALFVVGVIQARTDRMQDALKSFRKIVDEHKESPLAPRAAGVVRALEASAGQAK